MRRKTMLLLKNSPVISLLNTFLQVLVSIVGVLSCVAMLITLVCAVYFVFKGEVLSVIMYLLACILSGIINKLIFS